jgi:hypothetical protein
MRATGCRAWGGGSTLDTSATHREAARYRSFRPYYIKFLNFNSIEHFQYPLPVLAFGGGGGRLCLALNYKMDQ